jgi:hypothetical protein
LAGRRRVIVFAVTADAGTLQEAARRIGAAVAALGIERFDLMGRPALRSHCGWRSRPPRRISATTPSLASCRLKPTKRGSKPSQRYEGTQRRLSGLLPLFP